MSINVQTGAFRTLNLVQGSTFNQVWVFRDSAGNIRDFTGNTARMKIKQTPAGATLLELTSANGGLTLGDAAGTLTYDITATQTESLEVYRGYYDVEEVAGAVITRLASGRVVIKKQITG